MSSVSQRNDSYLRNGDHIHLALDANSAHLHLQAAQLAQTQVDRWKLVAELLIQLLLEVSRLHVLDDTRLNKVYLFYKKITSINFSVIGSAATL